MDFKNLENVLPQTGRFQDEDGNLRNVILYGMPSIDMVHEHIHRKQFFDAQKVYEDIANAGKIGFNIVAGAAQMHVIITVDAEGKSRFRSYMGTTFSDPGVELATFNRFIDDAPDPLGKLYESPIVDVQGPQRFDKLILGGLGPQSTGATAGYRVESIIAPGYNIYVEIENVSGQAKDIGVAVEWYEV